MEKQIRLRVKSIDGFGIPAVWHHERDNISEKTDKDIVVMAHGIFSTKDERGRYVRQAHLHIKNGCEVIRFDFRGHGEHPISPIDTTIVGMIVDFKSILNYARSKTSGKINIVASSFGAGIFLLYLQTARTIKIGKIALLNPVVDFKATLLEADLEWGKSLFNNNSYKYLNENGYIVLEEGFKMSEAMVIEMELLRPFDTFKAINIPTLIIHGDNDAKVPYNITKERSNVTRFVNFKTIHGADHAFKPLDHEEESFRMIMDWFYGTNDNELLGTKSRDS